MSLISNVLDEVTNGEKKQKIEVLRQLRDDVELFDEIDCGSINAALGRYCSIETIGVLKRFKQRVIEVLS